jgi:hypothetical protein
MNCSNKDEWLRITSEIVLYLLLAETAIKLASYKDVVFGLVNTGLMAVILTQNYTE